MAFSIPDTSTLDTALSVAGLTAYIQDLLEQDGQLRQVWVTGEVSSTNRHRSGLFFTLQDPEAPAAIHCVVWNSQLSRLAIHPEPGEQVIVLGQLQVYPQRGSYQLVIWQVFPAGEGLRALRLRQLRNRLAAEGLFDPERKRPLPPYPQVIAVVTSVQAAAWGDIQRTLKRRYPGLPVLFSPAIVQGEQAPSSIAQAIARVVRDGRAELLILSRGGGATEDLECFNDERVVRAIANCPIPVITGIGHQRDESLVDLVADVCAHTPTAAAEQAVPELDDLIADHQDRLWRLQQAGHRCLAPISQQLVRLRGRLHHLRPDRSIQQQQQVLHWLRQRLIQSSTHRLHTAQQHDELLQQKLATLDPSAVLQRGYALVRSERGGVRSAAELTAGQRLTVYFAQGEASVVVETIALPSPPPSS